MLLYIIFSWLILFRIIYLLIYFTSIFSAASADHFSIVYSCLRLWCFSFVLKRIFKNATACHEFRISVFQALRPRASFLADKNAFNDKKATPRSHAYRVAFMAQSATSSFSPPLLLQIATMAAISSKNTEYVMPTRSTIMHFFRIIMPFSILFTRFSFSLLASRRSRQSRWFRRLGLIVLIWWLLPLAAASLDRWCHFSLLRGYRILIVAELLPRSDVEFLCADILILYLSFLIPPSPRLMAADMMLW